MAFTFCILGSGSAGNCTLVRCGDTTVLVDAGFSAREMTRRLSALGVATDAIDAILLTHEHSDHAAGAATASRRWQVPILCRPSVARRLKLEDRAHGVAELPAESFNLGHLQITPFDVPHDAVETVGFVLAGEGIKAGYASDLGHLTPAVQRHLSGCNILALEANHDVDLTREGPYPFHLKRRILGEYGHLSNESAGSLLRQVVSTETRKVFLTHLSRTNNAPHLALMATRAALENGRQPQVPLAVAGQDRPGEAFRC